MIIDVLDIWILTLTENGVEIKERLNSMIHLKYNIYIKF